MNFWRRLYRERKIFGAGLFSFATERRMPHFQNVSWSKEEQRKDNAVNTPVHRTAPFHCPLSVTQCSSIFPDSAWRDWQVRLFLSPYSLLCWGACDVAATIITYVFCRLLQTFLIRRRSEWLPVVWGEALKMYTTRGCCWSLFARVWNRMTSLQMKRTLYALLLIS